LDEPWDSEHNQQFHNLPMPTYKCPSSPGGYLGGGCYYSAIAGGAFNPATEAGSVVGMQFEEITDGTYNTLAIVEVKEPFCWMDPTADVTLEEFAERIKVGSNHSGGFNAAMLDSSVRFITTNVPSETLRALATPDGGENVSL
jgi:prepilin-type processing-associated H-X9-DG protein